MRNQCYSANEMMKSTSEPFNCVSVQANAYLRSLWKHSEVISIKLKSVKEEVKRSNLTTILYYTFLNTDFPSDFGQIKPSCYMTPKRADEKANGNIMMSGNNLP